MANKNPRIPIPRDPEGLLALAVAVKAKHDALGAASPLQAMEDYNWSQVGALLTTTDDLQDRISDMEKKLEELYAERNRHLPVIKGALTSSRNVLKGIYAQNMKKLGEWGYTVDHTPRKKAVKQG
ncbi:MAG: hypothetical protein EOO16_16555 [Chitinophagaceae bacterium]|nr:MAG: hypothetical protein EOO16_16555 [Chitinophagaceae bacterium]